MKNNFTLRWTLANALGMSLGFVVAQEFLMFYEYGLNFENHWAFEKVDIDMSENAILLGKGIALAIFGSIFCLGQALVLKQYLRKIWTWVLNGALGFMVVLLIIWPIVSIWGSIPGPVEPLTLVLGGTLFMLVLQWRYLKKKGIKPARPILWYAAGTLLGLLPVVILFMFIWPNVPWGVDLAIMGVLMGGAAGLLSAKHFQKVLEERNT